MQKLFYVVCRWLEEDNSRQSIKICDMIKSEMQQTGFNYDSISNTQRQRQELYRERQKLIKEKEKLEEQKRQIEVERQHNLRLIQEKENLQKERQDMERRLNNEQEQGNQLRQENQQLQGKRQSMIHQYERLQDERDKIIEQRQLLYERMEKIQKLQRLQKMYQQQLKRLRQQAQIRGQGQEQEEKQPEEQQKEIQLSLPKAQFTQQNTQVVRAPVVKQSKPTQTSQNQYPVHSLGFSHINQNRTQYSGPISISRVPNAQLSSQIQQKKIFQTRLSSNSGDNQLKESELYRQGPGQNKENQSSTVDNNYSYVPSYQSSYTVSEGTTSIPGQTSSYVPSHTSSYVAGQTSSYVAGQTSSYVAGHTSSYSSNYQSVYRPYVSNFSSSQSQSSNFVHSPYRNSAQDQKDSISQPVSSTNYVSAKIYESPVRSGTNPTVGLQLSSNSNNVSSLGQSAYKPESLYQFGSYNSVRANVAQSDNIRPNINEKGPCEQKKAQSTNPKYQYYFRKDTTKKQQ